MQIQTIAGYKFIYLDKLPTLRENFLKDCQSLMLKGTILLSGEGININLAGKPDDISKFKMNLKQDNRFTNITFRETLSRMTPFKRLKVKIKREIITLKKLSANPCTRSAPSMTPATLKQWLDEEKQFTLLDVRNNFEIELGTFKNAINLNIKHFSDFPKASKHVPLDKPIVMFCTGGIRCEKAALCMMDQGYSEVYQLEGGILNYFIKVGAAYYNGACFVFDERITVDATQYHSV